MLQRSSSSKKNSHVVWDEENLKTNLEIQKRYSVVKIAEPKTPYRAPLQAGELEEDDEDMKPLELDDADAQETAKAAVMTAFDYVMRNGGADYSPPGPSRRRMASSNADDAGEGSVAMADVGEKRNEPSTSFTSSGSEGAGVAGSGDKKRRFEELRKQHYNMKQALQQARQLLASEDEEEDEVKDTAGWATANGDGVPDGDSNHHGDEEQQQQQGREQQQQQQQQGGVEPAGVQDMDSSFEQPAG